MSKQNLTAEQILGHFHEGEIVILVEDTAGVFTSQEVIFRGDINLYAAMDTQRGRGAEDEAILFLLDEAHVFAVDAADPRRAEGALMTFRLDESIPTIAQVLQAHEDFPQVAPLAAYYHNNAREAYKLTANAAFNEIVNGLATGASFEYLGGSQILLRDYLTSFFKAFDTEEQQQEQAVNFFGYLVNVLAQARELRKKAKDAKEVLFSVVEQVSSDGSRLNHVYTVGLSKSVEVEFIIAVENGDISELSAFLQMVASRYHAKLFDLDVVHTDFGQLEDGTPLRVKFREVPLEPALEHYLKETEGKVTEVWQILLADAKNVLPGEDGYDTTFNQQL